MTSAQSLPSGFESLAGFVAQWAAPNLAERDARRLESSAAERATFYAGAKDLLPQAMNYLDAKSLEDFDARDERLMNMMLTLIHVALAVEVQAEGEDIHASGARNLPIIRGHADAPIQAG